MQNYLNTLLSKYEVDSPHSQQVQKLSELIFDEMRKMNLHDLSDKQRALLSAGSFLHDIGYSIEAKGHNKHSARLIRKEDFEGLSQKKKETIALIARYHRGGLPRKEQLEYERVAQFGDKALAKALKLAGIVRLADALDREHLSLVHDIEFEYEPEYNLLWIKTRSSIPDFKLDIDYAIRKKDLLERAFGLQVVVISK